MENFLVGFEIHCVFVGAFQDFDDAVGVIGIIIVRCFSDNVDVTCSCRCQLKLDRIKLIFDKGDIRSVPHLQGIAYGADGFLNDNQFAVKNLNTARGSQDASFSPVEENIVTGIDCVIGNHIIGAEQEFVVESIRNFDVVTRYRGGAEFDLACLPCHFALNHDRVLNGADFWRSGCQRAAVDLTGGIIGIEDNLVLVVHLI